MIEKLLRSNMTLDGTFANSWFCARDFGLIDLLPTILFYFILKKGLGTPFGVCDRYRNLEFLVLELIFL